MIARHHACTRPTTNCIRCMMDAKDHAKMKEAARWHPVLERVVNALIRVTFGDDSTETYHVEIHEALNDARKLLEEDIDKATQS